MVKQAVVFVPVSVLLLGGILFGAPKQNPAKQNTMHGQRIASDIKPPATPVPPPAPTPLPTPTPTPIVPPTTIGPVSIVILPNGDIVTTITFDDGSTLVITSKHNGEDTYNLGFNLGDLQVDISGEGTSPPSEYTGTFPLNPGTGTVVYKPGPGGGFGIGATVPVGSVNGRPINIGGGTRPGGGWYIGVGLG